MNEEYILLRKENNSLNSLIGKSFNQKNKFEAEKILAEIHSKAQKRMIGKTVLCYVHDKGEIKGVGGSTLMKDKNGIIVSNLILDQFGIWLSGLPSIVSSGTRTIIVKDESGADRTFNIRNSIATFYNTSLFSLGMSLQVGSGSTSPTRTDVNIETAFGTAPESGVFVLSSNGAYNSGLGNVKYFGGITAGGAGTINECISQGKWRDSIGVARNITLFRDIISPAQAFILAQSSVL